MSWRYGQVHVKVTYKEYAFVDSVEHRHMLGLVSMILDYFVPCLSGCLKLMDSFLMPDLTDLSKLR